MTDSFPANKHTLDSEIRLYCQKLPYWQQFLCSLILSGIEVGESHLEVAYGYLLENLGLKSKSEREPIELLSSLSSTSTIDLTLRLVKVGQVEGVNALAEGQVIEFDDHLTVIYGSNGSGKSGYVRLLKKAFYSKAKEEILPDVIHEVTKATRGVFTFIRDDQMLESTYPEHIGETHFNQFAVFDGKCVIKHLDQRNEFEFRPAALGFFSRLIDAINHIESRLNHEIALKNVSNPVLKFLDGESDIKAEIRNVVHYTNIGVLKSAVTFDSEDDAELKQLQIVHQTYQYEKINRTEKNKELEKILELLVSSKSQVLHLNTILSPDSIRQVHQTIAEYFEKESISKVEGATSFSPYGIKGIGSSEWKSFIQTAELFAKSIHGDEDYPQDGAFCLLCNQLLDEASIELIRKYWIFVKSFAEKEALQKQNQLNEKKRELENLKFDLFDSEETILNHWLSKHHFEFLRDLRVNLKILQELALKLISCIDEKKVDCESLQIDLRPFDELIDKVRDEVHKISDGKLPSLNPDNSLRITELLHKQKISEHWDELLEYVEKLKWVSTARSLSWMGVKRGITDTDKDLSFKYFNQKYINTFNTECIELDGNFGIEIDAKGSKGRTNRQLLLKGLSPFAILSEGEQKVIALADFLSETKHSDINRGIIFDDPVTSLDEERKIQIAKRLVSESRHRQVIIFTHDLIFVSALLNSCADHGVSERCHWIERTEANAGVIWLDNTPSYEKRYRNSDPAKDLLRKAGEAGPEIREFCLTAGFTALRTCYESLVIFELFSGVVQRFEERVSVDSLKNVNFNAETRDEIMESFHQCCRYMEGHLHSDKYAYKKPTLQDLRIEIQRFDNLKSQIKNAKKITP